MTGNQIKLGETFNHSDGEWYAIQSKPFQEKFAEMNLEKLGVETFFPRMRQEKFIRRKKQTLIRPLFPGYFFARFNFSILYRAVKYAHGVRNLVSFGSVPVIVDPEIIESIKRQSLNGIVSIQKKSFQSGQSVRIQGGPFNGLEAIFEQEMSDRQRAVLLLRTLSYQARVLVDLEEVVGC